MPYNNNMSNRSVRQVVKVSIGGDMIRLKLSNIYSTEPVVIRSIYIAHAKDSFAIDPKSAKYLKFGNQYKVTIPAGKASQATPCPMTSSLSSDLPSPSTILPPQQSLPSTWVPAPPLIS